jgi:4a-hydroxytetrahydrobiopterin dehydratase
MNHQWTARPKPDRVEWLERRLEFNDYASNRDFLDRLNDFCEQQGRFPDISFGRTYVNITLRAEIEGAAIETKDHEFAASIDSLV